jgi:hypothetical protein
VQVQEKEEEKEKDWEKRDWLYTRFGQSLFFKGCLCPLFRVE